MIILLDLDGTLTNTTDYEFKPVKDGKIDTDIQKIPTINGAKEFVEKLKNMGHIPIIASDSHPKYVGCIAKNIFDVNYISLCDKPNTNKIINYLRERTSLDPNFPNIDCKKSKDDFLFVGDSWLDIEIGRRLNIRTILTNFYKTNSIEERDGIGQSWKATKMGPTYYANTFEDLLKIIENPIKNLLALEAIFQGEHSDKVIKIEYEKQADNFSAFRCLARQEDGECDRFARADKYLQIDQSNRSQDFLKKLANGISNYLARVTTYPKFSWDYLTYVSDKATTTPPNKMREIFDLVESKIPKAKLFEWTKNVDGRLRMQPNLDTRKEFISKHIYIEDGVDLTNKNIIVIDDQLTTSATAKEITRQLKNKGAKNILFIALFYLITSVESKDCPRCGKALKIKIKAKDGNKFYSCVPPRFNGNGCGYIENIK